MGGARTGHPASRAVGTGWSVDRPSSLGAAALRQHLANGSYMLLAMTEREAAVAVTCMVYSAITVRVAGNLQHTTVSCKQAEMREAVRHRGAIQEGRLCAGPRHGARICR